MGDPGLNAETLLQLYRTILYWVIWTFASGAFLGFFVYVFFVCLEAFSQQSYRNPDSSFIFTQHSQPTVVAS